MRTFSIPRIETAWLDAAQEKIDNLNKPKGSLGRLEELARQVCAIQETLSPRLSNPCHLLFGGDHGIEREGVSVSPREVTWQQMVNFTRGGGGVNMFCRQHGFRLRIIDVGVDHDLTAVPGIINRKIARGTGNFLWRAAMSAEQFEQAIGVGVEMADGSKAEGCNILSIGEMGIANTSAASLWMSLLGDESLVECVGAGAGLDEARLEHKRGVLSLAQARYLLREDLPQEDMPLDVLVRDVMRYFGGFEMVAAVGAMLRGAEHRMVILVDGFIMSACALAAIVLHPEVRHYMVFTHCGDEHGHRRLVELCGARPLLQLGLRLGEGTGALCAYPIIDSAVRMVNEMNSFQRGGITKYF